MRPPGLLIYFFKVLRLLSGVSAGRMTGRLLTGPRTLHIIGVGIVIVLVGTGLATLVVLLVPGERLLSGGYFFRPRSGGCLAPRRLPWWVWPAVSPDGVRAVVCPVRGMGLRVAVLQ